MSLQISCTDKSEKSTLLYHGGSPSLSGRNYGIVAFLCHVIKQCYASEHSRKSAF